MKNKGLIITLIVISVIVIFASIAAIALYFIRGKSFRLVMWGTKSENVLFDKNYNIDEVQGIEIKQDAGDVTIKESSNDEIRVVLYGEKQEDVKVNLSGNKLNIDFKHTKKFKFREKLNDIIIYIPSEYSNEIKIVNNAGECKMADFEDATIDFEFNAGNIEMGKVKDAKIRCDVGNVEIKEVLNKCNIEAACGNIRIDKLSIKENSRIKANLGDINIKEAKNVYIDAKVNAGDSNIKENDRRADVTLKIECDLGNVDVGR